MTWMPWGDALPDARTVADAMFEKDNASRLLGITIPQVDDGSAVATMEVTASMCNGHEVCHGGFLFTLADSAMAFACNAANEVSLAAGAGIEFLEPARLGAVLTATAARRHQRGRSSIYDVTVTGPDGTVIALFQGRTRSLGTPLLPDPPDDGSA